MVKSFGTINGTVITIGECGLLLRGNPGSGKSSFALQLIDASLNKGLFARLVGDDYVRLFVASNRLIAKPHPEIEGKIEIRGLGIIPVPFEKACILRLIIDIKEDVERMPQIANNKIDYCGVNLCHLNMWNKNLSVINLFHALNIFGLL